MHLIVYKKFEEILSKFKITGKVLEVGAVPSSKSLLASKLLDTASEKIGINLEGPYEFKDFKIIKGNANKMDMFKDETFNCVLCNATLEHDKYFWKTISEIRRVLKKGGLLIIGTPSYTNINFHNVTKSINWQNFDSDLLRDMTICFKIHNDPGDYYRFSEQTFSAVFFDGFQDVVIETIMLPPRTIGYGFK